MKDYDKDFQDRQIKHMEMAQAVVTRLAGNSFLVKGWAITVAGVFFGFAVNGKEWELAVASVLPVLIFWGLDASFLRSERLFRKLYGLVREGGSIEPFSLDATSAEFKQLLKSKARSKKTSWLAALFSATLLPFYGAMIVSAAIVLVFVLSID